MNLKKQFVLVGLQEKGLKKAREPKESLFLNNTPIIFLVLLPKNGGFRQQCCCCSFCCIDWTYYFLAERHKSQFSRAYGYGVASIIFVHFLINIGMVMGLIPTIGIPLPFFSYGGSGLLAFTILIFIFLKLDANRLNVW